MLKMKILLVPLFLVVVVSFDMATALSTSESCSCVNGVCNCERSHDQQGNVAGASSMVSTGIGSGSSTYNSAATGSSQTGGVDVQSSRSGYPNNFQGNPSNPAQGFVSSMSMSSSSGIGIPNEGNNGGPVSTSMSFGSGQGPFTFGSGIGIQVPGAGAGVAWPNVGIQVPGVGVGVAGPNIGIQVPGVSVAVGAGGGGGVAVGGFPFGVGFPFGGSSSFAYTGKRK